MEAFKLLTRSARLKSQGANTSSSRHFPSEGPSRSSPKESDVITDQAGSGIVLPFSGKKRKRDSNAYSQNENPASDIAFFDDQAKPPTSKSQISGTLEESQLEKSLNGASGHRDEGETLSEDQRRSILKRHKIKIVDLEKLRSLSVKDIDQSGHSSKKHNNLSLHQTSLGHSRKALKESCQVFPQPLTSFHQLRSDYNVNKALVKNVLDQGYTTPTEVQLGTLPLLLAPYTLPRHDQINQLTTPNLLTIAPTGSGKTLAFLIPLFNGIIQKHHETSQDASDRHVSAIILVPTKELVHQIVNESRKLIENTGVRITAMRKGMSLNAGPKSFRSDEVDEAEDEREPTGENPHVVVKSDVLVSTPLILLNAISHGSDKVRPLPYITSLILDEADVLLDPLFRDQTLALWNACSNPNLHVSFWSATIGSSIEELVMAVLGNRRTSLNQQTKAPLLRCIIGLKDSALPAISHKLIYAATEPGKLLGLRQLLHPSPSTDGRRSAPSIRPPFLVFTQTIERAVALHSELLYDIPSEAGGSSRIAILHSELSDSKRSDVMTRFRKGQIWVLITTDLLSRGVDFRGINGVVNYDIPTTSASYVHRVGRTGRAGREGGAAVTFYTKEDIKYVKGIANVIAASENTRDKKKAGEAGGDGDGEGVQKWLLNALPDVSKQEKKRLKTRGVEVRRRVRADEDPRSLKAKRRARISSKSGYERRRENNRRGAVQGSRRRQRSDADLIPARDDEWGGLDD